MLLALLQRLKRWRFNLLVLRPHVTLYIILVCCHLRRKPLLKTIHKKARKQFAEDMSTKHMDYWNHLLWSDEIRINLQVVESYISLKETWTLTCTVKYCSRAWSPLSRNWVAGQCSSMSMTQNTPPRRPQLYWRGWGLRWGTGQACLQTWTQ